MIQKRAETELVGQPARRAALQAMLAQTLCSLNLTQEAIPLREKVRDYYLANLGPLHLDTLEAMNNLSGILIENYRGEEGLKLVEHVVATRRKLLGSEHPKTLGSMLILGNGYAAVGRRAEALKLREEHLALVRKLRGPEHLETLSPMFNLASSYRNAGREDEAIKLWEEVLRLRRKLSGTESKGTILAMKVLAESYMNIGRPKDAIELGEEALALSRRVLGSDNSLTLAFINVLAYSYLDVGRFNEAIKLQEEVLPLFRKVNGPEHPDTLYAMRNLAVSYEAAGRKDEVRRLREEFRSLHGNGIAARDSRVDKQLVDLTAFYNARMDKSWSIQDVNPHNDLSELPTGIQVFAGTRFDIRGLVQICGIESQVGLYPDRITGIPVGLKGKRLRFLLGVLNGNDTPDGTVLAKHMLTYADRSTAERPLVAGKDVMDWWTPPPASGEGTPVVGWSGHNEEFGPTHSIQLYVVTWDNPRPEEEIASLDFISTRKGGAPFLVAVTVE